MGRTGQDGHSTATGADDDGGKCYLFSSATGNAPWTLRRELPWARVAAWGDCSEFEGVWLLATERGNGFTYRGMSLDSNKLYWAGG
jgi:hypothetical protein